MTHYVFFLICPLSQSHYSPPSGQSSDVQSHSSWFVFEEWSIIAISGTALLLFFSGSLHQWHTSHVTHHPSRMYSDQVPCPSGQNMPPSVMGRRCPSPSCHSVSSSKMLGKTSQLSLLLDPRLRDPGNNVLGIETRTGISVQKGDRGLF